MSDEIFRPNGFETGDPEDIPQVHLQQTHDGVETQIEINKQDEQFKSKIDFFVSEYIKGDIFHKQLGVEVKVEIKKEVGELKKKFWERSKYYIFGIVQTVSMLFMYYLGKR